MFGIRTSHSIKVDISCLIKDESESSRTSKSSLDMLSWLFVSHFRVPMDHNESKLTSSMLFLVSASSKIHNSFVKRFSNSFFFCFPSRWRLFPSSSSDDTIPRRRIIANDPCVIKIKFRLFEILSLMMFVALPRYHLIFNRCCLQNISLTHIDMLEWRSCHRYKISQHGRYWGKTW